MTRASDQDLFERWRGWAVDHGGDPGQVYAVGFSMGAHYTAGLVCSGVELAGAGVIGMSMVDAMEQRCTGRPTPIAYVVSAEDRFATPGPLQITGLSVTLTSQEQTWDRFRTLDACEALGEPKLLKAAKTWEPSCTKAPLWIAQVPGSTHAMRPRGFDTIRAIWAFWERSAKR